MLVARLVSQDVVNRLNLFTPAEDHRVVVIGVLVGAEHGDRQVGDFGRIDKTVSQRTNIRMSHNFLVVENQKMVGGADCPAGMTKVPDHRTPGFRRVRQFCRGAGRLIKADRARPSFS